LKIGETEQTLGVQYMAIHQSKVPPAHSSHSRQNSKERPLENPLPERPIEVGGPKGLEPTRYGDWEKAGRCSDF
jgi:hypothetical protein